MTGKGKMSAIICDGTCSLFRGKNEHLNGEMTGKIRGKKILKLSGEINFLCGHLPGGVVTGGLVFGSERRERPKRNKIINEVLPSCEPEKWMKFSQKLRFIRRINQLNSFTEAGPKMLQIALSYPNFLPQNAELIPNPRLFRKESGSELLCCRACALGKLASLWIVGRQEKWRKLASAMMFLHWTLGECIEKMSLNLG